jgi:hypothetical protein
MTCFSYSKNDFFVWIPKASVNMTARFSLKKRQIEHDLVFIFKNSCINNTHSQGYYCQTKNWTNSVRGKTQLSSNMLRCHPKTHLLVISMLLNIWPSGTKFSFFLLTVCYSKTIETEVRVVWENNWANGMTPGFYLILDTCSQGHLGTIIRLRVSSCTPLLNPTPNTHALLGPKIYLVPLLPHVLASASPTHAGAAAQQPPAHLSSASYDPPPPPPHQQQRPACPPRARSFLSSPSCYLCGEGREEAGQLLVLFFVCRYRWKRGKQTERRKKKKEVRTVR